MGSAFHAITCTDTTCDPTCTAPVYDKWGVTVYHHEALALLRTWPDACVESVICDPPYAIEFMGGRNAWDKYDSPLAFQQWIHDIAAECLRVLKPGGHVAMFGGTRTFHRLACGIEDAGFDIRDDIGCGVYAWCYGSGFVKNHDISKAIDKMAEVNVETSRRIAAVGEVIAKHREAAGLSRQDVSERIVGTRTGACWNWEHQQLPSVELWPAIKALLNIPDRFDALIEGDRARFIAAEREVIGTKRAAPGVAFTSIGPTQLDVTAPATDAARQWQGWGSAISPAWEPIIVGRKPLAGTIAQTVLAYGTGGMNIDACRVATDEDRSRPPRTPNTIYDHGSGTNLTASESNPAGRWPSNVLFAHAPLTDPATGDIVGDACANGCTPGCQVRTLDEQSGILHSQDPATRKGSHGKSLAFGDRTPGANYADTGGASRFYPQFRYGPDDARCRYEAKAPKSERPQVDGKAGSTVKPLGIMRWIIRLLTPPGGTVLDWCAGSGATGQAARAEGFRAVLIDQDRDSIDRTIARLDARPRTEAPTEPGTAPAPADDHVHDLLDLLDGAT